MSAPSFSPQAAGDIDNILAYIAEDNPRAAAKFGSLLIEKCRLLAAHPEMGAPRDELIRGVRSLPVGHYVIYYTMPAGTVRIERVLHAARDRDTLLGKNE